MAKRPVFVPALSGDTPFVREVDVEFLWFAGMAKSQAQKSIESLHQATAAKYNLFPTLEISSKSKTELGVSLSAFNLMLTVGGYRMSVECAFQGSKVFEDGSSYPDLYEVSSREAKTDERLRNAGDVIAFRLFDDEFPINPTTAFYDWLYLSALWENTTLASELTNYAAFSDIAFNPQKSLNCQARSAALYVSLCQNNLLEQALADKEAYFQLLSVEGRQPALRKEEAAQLGLSI